MSSKLKGIGAVMVVIAAVSGILLYNALDTSASDVADNTTPLKDVVFDDKALISRGEYVMRTGDCVACHTESNGDFAGGYEIATNFGSLTSSNITPDPQTGIGDMTERDFYNAIRQGIGSHGLLYPAMPFTAYRKMSDDDMHALWAYMSTITPVRHEINETEGMSFPFNIRLAMAGWDLLFFENEGFAHNPNQSEAYNRGAYLSEGPAHCGTCHTPRNLLGAEQNDQYFQGYNMGDWYAPDITPNPGTLVGGSADELAAYLHTGTNGHAVAAGPMAEAIEFSLQYLRGDDIDSLVTYLQAQAPSGKPPSGKSVSESAPSLTTSGGELTYEINCAACHGVEGEGIKGMVPSFIHNGSILNDDPTNLLHAMLLGARAPSTEMKPTAAGMPSFAWKMNNREIADILNYIRNSWGNAAIPVTESSVADVREKLKARNKLVQAE